jgi:Spy/CpxP family protein refolding chaperone
VLTPEQRKKLAERVEEMRERRGRGRGWWHRG